MALILLIAAAGAILIFAAILWHGGRQSTKQGSWPVVGWLYTETKNPDGTITVVTPDLETLLEQRHAHTEETDPQLEAWALAEMEAMRQAFLTEGQSNPTQGVHWHDESAESR